MGGLTEKAQKLFNKQVKQKPLTIWDILARVRQDPRNCSIAIQAWGGFGKTT